MSRMTAAQVITLGQYLEPDFDPSTLTVPQLLGVFGFHNIKYPSTSTKPKLVQLFNEEIRPRSNKLKRERLKKENSAASDDGIKDGLTGKPIGEDTGLVRRSSRRVSRAPSLEEKEPSPVRPEPPKRRRSSAQPNLGGPSSRKIVPIGPALAEESEPDEVPDEVPVRKVGRNKKSSADVASQVRRVSQTQAEDSGWEDNNVFQSGAESSSPVRPSPPKAKPRRVSTRTTAPRKSHKATSAPPQLPPSPPKRISVLPDTQQLSSPQTSFEPNLPSSATRKPKIWESGSKRTSFAPDEMQNGILEIPNMVPEEEEFDEDPDKSVMQVRQQILEGLEDEIGDSEEESENETTALSRRIAAGNKQVVRRPRSSQSRFSSLLMYAFFALLSLAVSPAVYKYKEESAQIGYCDTGSDTNKVLETMKERWRAVEACIAENKTLVQLPPIPNTRGGGELIPCPPPDLVPLPHPTSCTPCPSHAKCTGYEMTCDTGYLLRPHSLLAFLPLPSATSSPTLEAAWEVIGKAANGLPGLGPVAFPQRCVEDPNRRKNIGALGKGVEAYLGQERGKRLCQGHVKEILEEQGGQARMWGLEVNEIKSFTRTKIGPRVLESFDNLFEEAISQLIEWGGVIIGKDSEGRKYLASRKPQLDLSCLITVKSREAWYEWQRTIFAIVFTTLAGFYWRSQRASRQIEDKRIGELVQVVLDTLRNQELAHHTDPITAPQPYISSLQLRDMILQDEHSISARSKLWNKVERVVESNANVRANLEELRGGDEMRVWRWIGSLGASSPRKMLPMNE